MLSFSLGLSHSLLLYNLACLSSPTFCIGALYHFSILYVLFQVCLAPAWLADTRLLPLFLPAQILPPPYTLCQPVLSVSPLPIYLLFSFLLHQSGALSRKGNTSLHCWTNGTQLYTAKQMQPKQMDCTPSTAKVVFCNRKPTTWCITDICKAQFQCEMSHS